MNDVQRAWRWCGIHAVRYGAQVSNVKHPLTEWGDSYALWALHKAEVPQSLLAAPTWYREKPVSGETRNSHIFTKVTSKAVKGRLKSVMCEFLSRLNVFFKGEKLSF